MLVLSRKAGESIIIDDDIEITVTEIRGNRVRLGITAPKEKRISRPKTSEKITSKKSDDNS